MQLNLFSLFYVLKDDVLIVGKTTENNHCMQGLLDRKFY